MSVFKVQAPLRAPQISGVASVSGNVGFTSGILNIVQTANVAVSGAPSVAAPSGIGMTLFSTTFPAAENPISQSSIWQRGATEGRDWTDPKTVSTPARACSSAITATYNDAVAHLKSASYPHAAAQWAQGTVYRAGTYHPPSSNHEIELLLRFDITTGDAHGYEVIFGLNAAGQGYIAVVKWLGIAGSYTALWDPGAGSITALVDTDVVRGEISGNSLAIYINGVKIGPSSTSAGNTGVGTLSVDLTKDTGGNVMSVWSSGQPGIGFWPNDVASTIDAYGWRAFSSGNL